MNAERAPKTQREHCASTGYACCRPWSTGNGERIAGRGPCTCQCHVAFEYVLREQELRARRERTP